LSSVIPDEISADLVLVNGRVITIDPFNYVAEAVAVKDGKVIRVGSTGDVKRLTGRKTKIIDLKGLTLLPGFIDTHEHCIRRGLQMDWVDCRTMGSLEEVVEALRAKAGSKKTGDWVVGSWFDESQWKDKRFPNRHDLDRASTDRPIYLGRAGGHNAVANSLALRLAGITRDTPQPSGGNIEKDEEGEPTGRLDEIAAMDIVRDIIPQPTKEEEVELLVRNWPTIEEELLSWGITTVHEAHIKAPQALAYQRLDREGRLRMRVGLMLDGMTPYKGYATDDLARQGITTPFSFSDNPGNRGILRCTQGELTSEVVRCHRAGLRTCTHAIGDRAIDVAMEAVETAVKAKPWPGHRHRIEHAGYVLPRQLRKMKELGVNVSASIGFCHPIGDSHIAALGQGRLCGYYPMRSFRDHGIVAAGNSDGFGTSWALTGIYGCVTRKSRTGQVLCKDEAIGIMDALRAYTVNAAYVEGSEASKGSIEHGKLADFVVMDRDITRVDPEEILMARVLMTIVGGEVVYEDSG
jgi:hypothetical protein